eukprot:1550186-Prymnesium_polylepis.1
MAPEHHPTPPCDICAGVCTFWSKLISLEPDKAKCAPSAMMTVSDLSMMARLAAGTRECRRQFGQESARRGHGETNPGVRSQHDTCG